MPDFRCRTDHYYFWNDNSTAATNESIWLPVQSWGCTENTATIITNQTNPNVWFSQEWQAETAEWHADQMRQETFLQRARQELGQGQAPAILPSERVQELRELERQYEQGVRERLSARLRARELLFTHLDKRQREMLERHGHFEVESQRGRLFRISQGYAGNIYLLERGRPAVRYCIHPVEKVPAEDAMLVQKLMIECNEDYFEVTANKTRLAA